MEETIRNWIVEILQQRKQLLTIAIRQRAKFEGWLKFELAASAERHDAQSVEVEAASDDSNSTRERSDTSFYFNGVRYDVELKTPNSNWRLQGVQNKTRPITKNVAGIVSDAKKLYHSPGQGIIAFVLFPVPPEDDRWTEYLNRISTALNISLTPQKHCARIPIVIGKNQTADLVVCSFSVPHRPA